MFVPRLIESPTHLLMIVVFVLCCNSQRVFAQEGTAVIKQLEVFRVFTSVNEDLGHNDEFRWKLWLNGRFQGCIQINGDRGNFNVSMDFLTDPSYDVTQPLRFTLETWENDGGQECFYERSEDEAHCGPMDFYLTLANHEPELTDTFEMEPCSAYKLWIRFSYTVPTPRNIALSPSGANFLCDERPQIILSSASFLNPAYLRNTTFVWEYLSSASPIWRRLGTATGFGIYSFDRIRQLEGIPAHANVDVNFRVRLSYRTSAGSTYSSEFTPPSEAIHLSPVAPSINYMSTQPACHGTRTGTIQGVVSGAYASYRYILRDGDAPCDPDAPESCGGIASGTFDAPFGFFEIGGFAQGTYTLVITNTGGTRGVCPVSYYPVVIGERPELALSAMATTVSCQNGADGRVTLSTTGGTTPVAYTLSKDGSSSDNATGLFTELPAGAYQATARDAICQQLVTTTVNVPEPVRVSAQTVLSPATCLSPANGSVQVNITSSGSTPPYALKLLRGTEVIQRDDHFSQNTWTAGQLPAGVYTIDVRDALRMQCDGVTEEIVLSAPEDFELIPAQALLADVDCYGRSNGSITLTGVDLNGQFKYTLTGSGGIGPRVLTTTATYSDLPADNYTLAMERNLDGCSERAVYPAELQIKQPQQSVIVLDKLDISCYGETNGRIAALVTGATPSDQYIWEVLLGGGWASVNNSSNTLENLSSGTYRMRLTNNFNCAAISPETTVIEPALLSIFDVSVKDVACFGGKGEVTAVLDGGTTPYTYVYTSATQAVNSPSSLTLLDPGMYTLQGRDARGCTAGYTGSIMLTAPERPLTMSVALSDYNGFNISCAGANDGYAALIGAGGNGGSFSGYTYALDNGAFQPDLYLRNIGAGDHTVFLRDARGCTIHTDVVMSAPASQLQALLLNKKDIKCAGDSNGSITLQAQGGVAPYSYALDGVSQPRGVFSSLVSGSYTIVITDRNHCIMEYETSIAVQITPMDVQLAHTDVWCHGGNNGTVQTQITGGASPFRYEWSGLPDQTAALNTLRAGNYDLIVTDQEGCKQRREFTIREPQALSVHATTIPVCVGKTNGEIRLRAEGGTPVYEYSINDGLAYQHDPQFLVRAGTYPVRIRDQHQCETPIVVDVTTRQDIPDPNFIVAMTQQASDTLLIREISLPKADSVWWTFDPAIHVVNNDHESPLITVSDPGSYDITMRGFFGGCDYTKTLALTISPFDPEVKVVSKIPVRVIKTLTATPNSNDGQFDMTVEMEAKQRLTVTIYDMLGVSHYRRSWDKTSGIVTAVDISGTAAAGIYVVQAVTDTDVREIRLVVNK